MICELCEVNEASITIIPTGEGMPQSVCSPCMARMGLGLAKEMLPAEEIAATLGPLFVRPEREDLQAPPDLKPKRGRKSKAALEVQEEGATGGPAEAPTAAAE